MKKEKGIPPREAYPWNLGRVRDRLGIHSTSRILILLGPPDFKRGREKRWKDEPPDASNVFGIFGDVRALLVLPLKRGGALRMWTIGTYEECKEIVKQFMDVWFSIRLGDEEAIFQRLINEHQHTKELWQFPRFKASPQQSSSEGTPGEFVEQGLL